ncbi:9477_t:CDS:2 [Funneliformis geosporum]|uniref:9477_t:CDS:1 n=1 Tax=Funneliformis geosporum TaxID=1117311 RepID=A0A9W4SBF1_9GLOM|nr:9477_t:CDS:2 [Funneliformis geosporum]
MKEYPINGLSSTISYANNLSSNIHDKDDYLNKTNSLINNSSFTLPTKNNDYYSIDVFDNSNKFQLYEESLKSFSSTSSSANSSTTSLSLPSSSTYSLPLSTSDKHDLYTNHYIYEPLSMTISEPKRHHEGFNNNSILNWNVYLSPFIFYSSGKINSIWRYLILSGILLGSFCYLDPFEVENKFIIPMKYLATCLIIFSLTFGIFTIFDNQFTNNTREVNHENSAGFVEPKFCSGGCCNERECGCTLRNSNFRDCFNFCTAGCLNICCFVCYR